MTGISSWLLIPIVKKRAIQDESFFLQEACFEAKVWRMSGFMTMLTWMKIKTMIFHMAKLVTMFAYNNLMWMLWKRSRIWNSWRWAIMKKSGTLKLNGLGIVWNMKGHLLVISKTCYVLVMDKLFPRSKDGLGKCRLDVCFYIQIFSCTRINDLNSFLMLMGFFSMF